MDAAKIGFFVNIVQLVVWTVAGSAVISRMFRTRRMPGSIDRLLSSNGVVGVLVTTGLICSVVTLLLYSNVPRYDIHAATTQIVDRTFSNEVVGVDGKQFLHCHFHDVRFKYNGTTPVVFKDCGFGGNLVVTTDNPAIQSALLLAKGLGFMPSAPVVGPNEELLPFNNPDPTGSHKK